MTKIFFIYEELNDVRCMPRSCLYILLELEEYSSGVALVLLVAPKYQQYVYDPPTPCVSIFPCCRKSTKQQATTVLESPNSSSTDLDPFVLSILLTEAFTAARLGGWLIWMVSRCALAGVEWGRLLGEA